MSNYRAPARHPVTGNVELAEWIDDHFGRHQYGVRFADGSIYTPEKAHTGWSCLRPTCCGGDLVVRIDERYDEIRLGWFNCPRCGAQNYTASGSIASVHSSDRRCVTAIPVDLVDSQDKLPTKEEWEQIGGRLKKVDETPLEMTLGEFFKLATPSDTFTPYHEWSSDGKRLAIYFKEGRTHSESRGDNLWLIRDADSGELVGVVLFGVERFKT